MGNKDIVLMISKSNMDGKSLPHQKNTRKLLYYSYPNAAMVPQP